jgi:leucyl/phenylalanyl-tRNA--protein transferase
VQVEPESLEELIRALPFPDPGRARPGGLLCHGGDLAPERLLAAYAQGVFPWYDEDPILWYSPDPRYVVRPAGLIVNRTLRKSIRRERYEIRIDTAFEEVVVACAGAPRPGQSGTWINDDMIVAYCKLHDLGFAHSVEAWQGGALVGGMYGVSLGAAFFGESMFARRSDASKVALVHLIRQLETWGFDFLDCQAHTDHMERLGAEAWSRADFLEALGRALKRPTRRGRWRLSTETAQG